VGAAEAASEGWMMMHSHHLAIITVLPVEVVEVVEAEEAVAEWEAWAAWEAWEASHPDSCQQVVSLQEQAEGDKAQIHSSSSKCE
jgi:hypothetical protein